MPLPARTAAAAVPHDELHAANLDPVTAAQRDAPVRDPDVGPLLRGSVHEGIAPLLLIEDDAEVRATRNGVIHDEVRQNLAARGATAELHRAVCSAAMGRDNQGGEVLLVGRLRISRRSGVATPWWHHQHRPVVGKVAADDAEDQGAARAGDAALDRAQSLHAELLCRSRGRFRSRRRRTAVHGLATGALENVAVGCPTGSMLLLKLCRVVVPGHPIV
mmetsp:Transcript_39385/g.116785  ORF Transcript_39385/g.116785 Transcript_39385/m.116785 type:complete len:218 (-) Transcript_39385:1335-1988(-)